MINIEKNILLSRYTTFRIGGPAKYFAEVKTEEELKEAIQHARENKLSFFVFGGGSNILASDQGFDGMAIKMKLSGFDIDTDNNVIRAGAGVPLAKVVRDSAENGLSGMEWAAGIPGTVGGAVRGNAGAFGGDASQVVESVKVLEISGGEISRVATYKPEDCKFEYRDSIFKHDENLIILSAVFKLRKGDREESRRKSQEIVAQRIAKQPQGMGSAGSFFINPVVENEKLRKEFEQEKSTKCKEKKIPAGWLIEKAGLKGKRIGGAAVSEIHPNYILNTGNATAEDVVMLASFVKQQVRDKLGVQLREEVQYIGF